MIHLRYRLNEENFKEMSSYMALHDKKMQGRLLTMIGSLIVFAVVLSCLIFRYSLRAVLFAAASVLLILCFMPRIYWNMVFRRVDHFVETSRADYGDVEVIIDENIHVREKGRRTLIPFSDIVNFDYTKHNCILFYRSGEKINTLILPVESFREDQLKEFHLRLMERENGKTGDC